MSVQNCLRLAKQLGDLGKSQESLFYLNRARDKVSKYLKYEGMKVEGFKLVKDLPKAAVPKPAPKSKVEENKDGKKSKG